MTPLTMQIKKSVSGRIDLKEVVPDRWQGLSFAEILQWPIRIDGQASTIADSFEVADGQRNQWSLIGDLRRCDHLAAGMRSGEITVAGNVGDYLAAGMQGGELIVRGDAGDYTASGMRGGRVAIHGNVGRYAAAAASESHRGMSGGTLVIHGDADQWLASRMRRGVVVVHGNIASGCAYRMVAGTVVTCGAIALPLGCGMKRGTLLVFTPSPTLLSEGCSGFTPPAPSELSFLQLLLHSLQSDLPTQLTQTLDNSRWHRCLGDRAELGLGEMFLREETTVSPASTLSPS